MEGKTNSTYFVTLIQCYTKNNAFFDIKCQKQMCETLHVYYILKYVVVGQWWGSGGVVVGQSKIGSFPDRYRYRYRVTCIILYIYIYVYVCVHTRT
jgi:hypothetical protein